MVNFFQSGWMSSWGFYMGGWQMFGFFLLLAWTLAWKGLALWKAARLNQQVWFIILLVVNTLGILDIIYIVFVAGKKEKAGKTE